MSQPGPRPLPHHGCWDPRLAWRLQPLPQRKRSSQLWEPKLPGDTSCSNLLFFSVSEIDLCKSTVWEVTECALQALESWDSVRSCNTFLLDSLEAPASALLPFREAVLFNRAAESVKIDIPQPFTEYACRYCNCPRLYWQSVASQDLVFVRSLWHEWCMSLHRWHSETNN